MLTSIFPNGDYAHILSYILHQFFGQNLYQTSLKSKCNILNRIFPLCAP